MNINNNPNQKQKGSGFTNIQKVLDANKGNQLGSSISQGLQQTAQNTQQAVNRATDRFNEQMKQGALGEEQKQQRDNVLSQVEQGQGVQDQDIQSFSRFRSGDYTGPQGLEDKQKLLQQANRGQQIAGSVGTQEGRQGLLQQFNTSPKYTRGTMRSDALFLGQAAPKLQQAASGLRETARNVQTMARSAEAQAEKAALESKAFGEETIKMLQERLAATQDPILQRQKEAKDLYAKQQTALGTLQSDLTGDIQFGSDTNDNLRKASLKRYAQTLGLDQEELNGLISQYDALRQAGFSDKQAGASLFQAIGLQQQDLSNLENIGAFTQQNELTKLNALKQLSGQNTVDYGDKLGSYKADDASADISGLRGLANIRGRANATKSEIDRLNHYITHAKAAMKNADFAANNADAQFLTEMNPEVAHYAFAKPPAGLTVDKQEEWGRENYEKFQRAKLKAIEIAKQKAANANARYSQIGNIDSLQAYRDYLNSLPKFR